MSIELLLAGLQALRAEGYDAISISGGEPFAYRHIDALIAGAHDQGFAVNLVTNATLLTPARCARMAPFVNLVAVSIDGLRDEHNHMRCSSTAFDEALRGMKCLRDAGLTFGVAFTVTKRTLHQLVDVYELCSEIGAGLLSVRPVVGIGRGAETDDLALRDDELARLFLTAQLLDSSSDGVRVRADVAPSSWLEEGQSRYATAFTSSDRLGDAINPLVIDAAGQLVPFAFGVHPRFHLGNIADISAAVDAAHESGLHQQLGLVRDAAAGLHDDGSSFADWYDRIAAASQRQPVVVGRRER